MSTTTRQKKGEMVETTGRELRWLADSYEQSQRIRIETGERIRAVVQGSDETFIPVGTVYTAEETGDEALWEDDTGVPRTADETLDAIKAGDTFGPVPILGRSYSRHWEGERDAYRLMQAALKSHPAWPWLEQVKGIGPTLACKLLARLDPEKAPTRSSFWKYCGLATVPGERYRCEECGLVRGFPVGYNVTGKHQPLEGSGQCKGKLEKVAGPEEGVKVAQPRAGKGSGGRTYDAYAKKIMYLVGTSFLKSGGPYEAFYRKERAKAETDRPGWSDGRKHHLALRKTEKLFLAHLWEIWREALGLPTEAPYAVSEMGHDESGIIRPEEMVA